MKPSHLLVVLAFFSVFTTSCKNGNNNSVKKAKQEIVQGAKTILAHDLLAKLDQIIDEEANSNNGHFALDTIFQLSQEEKLVKPDYLFVPQNTLNLMLKSQKIYALATLLCQQPVRKAFDLPTEEAQEAIGKLTTELNHKIVFDGNNDVPFSQRLREGYSWYKEHNNVDYYWKFSYAIVENMLFLLSKNIEPALRNFTAEDNQLFWRHILYRLKAIKLMSDTDDEMALIYKNCKTIFPDMDSWIETNGESNKYAKDVDGMRQYLTDMKETLEKSHKAVFEKGWK